MTTFWQDLRYGARMLLKHRGFTLVAVLTLALGTGANTAIFSLVNAVLLRPLPYSDPQRLVMLWEDQSAIGFPRGDAAPADFADWKAQASTFEDMAAFDYRGFNLTGGGEPEKVSAFGVTANLFPLLGVQPVAGRNFTAEEDQPGGPKAVMLSYGLWQRRYGGEMSIIGRDILLNDEKYTVAGVMPSDFQFMQDFISLWVPAALTKEQLADHDNHYLTVVGRIRPDATFQQASAEISAISERIAHDHPDEAKDLAAAVVPLREQLTGEVRRPLLFLLGAVALVLLIACTNIASLLLSKAAARRKEIAVRAALGASRLRLVRQLLTESILLATAGGTFGLLIAMWSFALLKQLVPPTMAKSVTLELDLPALAYAVGISLITGILFGLIPALQASKIEVNETLKQAGGRSAGAGGKLRGTFVVAEIAMALVLLIAAGLLIQTVFNLRGQYAVLQPEKLLTLRTGLIGKKYAEADRRVAFYDQVLERVRALPGVTAAGYTTSVPLQWKGGATGFTIEGQPTTPGTRPNAIHRQVSAGYFQTLGIGLKEGRYFDEHDTGNSLPVVVVNETLARQYWPDESALGKRIKLGFPANAPWLTIAGIVADVRQMGMDAPVKAEMYIPYRQIANYAWFAPRDLVIRTSGEPLALVAAVRQEIYAVDPNEPLSNIATMEELLTEETGSRRIGMILLSLYSGLALLLASLGIYGVLSYVVAQQTPEIGVRMALGAARRDILAMVVKKGMRWTATGVAIGAMAALGLNRLMASLLFGISATDPLTFAAVAGFLAAVALLACYLPARRAANVDPMVALRYE